MSIGHSGFTAIETAAGQLLVPGTKTSATKLIEATEGQAAEITREASAAMASKGRAQVVQAPVLGEPPLSSYGVEVRKLPILEPGDNGVVHTRTLGDIRGEGATTRILSQFEDVLSGPPLPAEVKPLIAGPSVSSASTREGGHFFPSAEELAETKAKEAAAAAIANVPPHLESVMKIDPAKLGDIRPDSAGNAVTWVDGHIMTLHRDNKLVTLRIQNVADQSGITHELREEGNKLVPYHSYYDGAHMEELNGNNAVQTQLTAIAEGMRPHLPEKSK